MSNLQNNNLYKQTENDMKANQIGLVPMVSDAPIYQGLAAGGGGQNFRGHCSKVLKQSSYIETIKEKDVPEEYDDCER